MPKVKNTLFDRYAFTISPRIGTSTVHELECAAESYRKKKSSQIEHIAYCIETGDEGDHPHLHFLCLFNSKKRRDTLTKSISSYFLKALRHENSPYFVDVAPAYEPQYWYSIYMRKQDFHFKNYGFSDEYMKSNSKKRAVWKLGQDLLPITRSNFLPLYHLNKDHVTYQGTFATDEHINALLQYYRKSGYAIHFFVYNKKQIVDLIKAYEGMSIEFVPQLYN